MSTHAFMQHLYRSFSIIVLAIICLACASAPAPERAPKDIYQGVRYLNKSASYYAKGCYPKALQHVQKAYERFSAADQLQGAADCLNTMADIYYRLGDFQSALAFYDETIELFEQLGANAGKVKALANKSAALIAAGRLDDASIILARAEKLAKKHNVFKSLCYKTRAMALIAAKDYKNAQGLLTEALEATPDSDQSLLADIYYTYGELMLAARRPQQAIGLLNKALDIDHAAGAYFNVAMDLATLGACTEDMAHYAEAVGFYKRSIKIFALLEAQARVQWVLVRLKDSAGKAGKSLQVTTHWTEQWIAGRQEAGLCR